MRLRILEQVVAGWSAELPLAVVGVSPSPSKHKIHSFPKYSKEGCFVFTIFDGVSPTWQKNRGADISGLFANNPAAKSRTRKIVFFWGEGLPVRYLKFFACKIGCGFV